MLAAKQSGFFKSTSMFFWNTAWSELSVAVLDPLTALLPKPDPVLATGIKELCSYQEQKNNHLIIIIINEDGSFKWEISQSPESSSHNGVKIIHSKVSDLGKMWWLEILLWKKNPINLYWYGKFIVIEKLALKCICWV